VSVKIFLSHARKDEALARQLRERLTGAGFVVWSSDEKIAPGDNWAKKIGGALEKSDLKVFLLTPKAMASDVLRQDIEFALGSRKYANRVFSVFVGPTRNIPEDMPWILLKFPSHQIESARDLGDVVEEIQNWAPSSVRHVNA
jgi:hypothetical protein